MRLKISERVELCRGGDFTICNNRIRCRQLSINYILYFTYRINVLSSEPEVWLVFPGVWAPPFPPAPPLLLLPPSGDKDDAVFGLTEPMGEEIPSVARRDPRTSPTGLAIESI